MTFNIDTILHGDSNQILPTIPSNFVDVIITDPPYGTDFKNPEYDDSHEYVFSHFTRWLSEFARILKDHGHLYVFVPTEHLDRWIGEIRKFFSYKNTLAFPVYTNNRFLMKNNFGFNGQYVIFAHKLDGKAFNTVDWIPTSACWLLDKRNPNPKAFTYCYPNYFGNLIYANVKNNAQRKGFHPNEKNPDLIQRFIELSTQEDEIVCDPFIGSGSTAIACLRSKRHFIGIEQSNTYYQTATDRIMAYIDGQIQSIAQKLTEKNTLRRFGI